MGNAKPAMVCARNLWFRNACLTPIQLGVLPFHISIAVPEISVLRIADKRRVRSNFAAKDETTLVVGALY
jgi:hypothetical protein